MPFEVTLFYAFGGLSILGAVAMLLQVRNLVAGVMSLVVTMVSLAGIYVLLEAHLIAVLQIMVYAGAILVLFLFVIMLLNLRTDDFVPIRPGQRPLKFVGAGIAIGGGLFVAHALRGSLVTAPAAVPEGFGGFRDVGLQLFTSYVVPVEAAGLILLAAIVGAVILAKRESE
ncbi:MAG: NADH-quinone oxidoreductase subunit J [Myxococcota bacterium]|nr:NADH-quinone oxidoreductase subunit J [Myxococcota bacterium]